ncbi:MAG TPA: RNA-binding protein [Dissulfurispiraceae bacterium]|nr:RNA-binding protein [Dissulfurispiraceae bacterium]
MGTKIYVGNISFNASEDDLKDLFSQYGDVESARIITDAQTGRNRGFGFVEMSSKEDAQKAITALNGSVFMERTLTVSEARPQQPREGRGGFGGRRSGGGGGGGFGRGRSERGRR